MKILAVIPARGGSKGVPRKNIRILNGKPLLQYTIEAAQGAHQLTRTILSTEDEEIARVGQQCGVDVPFMRPVELAADNTPTLPVIQHAVRWMEMIDEVYDAVCLLQPTNPFRTSEQIDACIALMIEHQSDSVVTMLPVPAEYNPHWVFFQDENGYFRLSTGEKAPIPRRQELPPAFHRDGSIYVTRRDILMIGNSLYGERIIGFVMEKSQSVNIDTLDDWRRAEELLRRRDR